MSEEKDPFFQLVAALAGTGAVALHNARMGFACNSSSSHSIIILPEGGTLPSAPSEDYGWDDFALTTPGEKLHYLAAQLGKKELTRLPDLTRMLAAEGVAANDLPGVDHQSILDWPYEREENEINAEFVKDFAEFLKNPRVAILGGNDNGDGSRYQSPDQVVFNIMRNGAWVARKDSAGDKTWWVLFNKHDGTKLRITLDPDELYKNAVKVTNYNETNLRPGPYLPAKAQTPELVDFKLTDACPFEKDCGFCFSGETEFLTIDGMRTFAETVGTKQFVLVSKRQMDSKGTKWKVADFGGEWVEADIKSFGVQKLLKVTLSRKGVKRVVYATAEHRWLVTPAKERGEKRIRKIVTTSDLKSGARLAPLFPRRAIHQGPVPTPPSHIGVAHGAVFGDGTLDGRKGSSINLHGKKDAALLPYFGPNRWKTHTVASGGTYVAVRNLPAYFKSYPDLNESSSYLYGWLAGWFAADGSITSPWGSPALDSASKEDIEFALKVCNRLGIGTYGIVEYERVGIDGVLGKMYRLRLIAASITPDFFVLPEHRARFENRKGRQLAAAWKVVSVEETGREEEVFCAVVPEHENFTLAGNINVMNCYMGSTVKGKEGELEFAVQALAALAKLGVFEVAFGGGEPTLWPHFAEIVEYCNQLGITPNATSRNYRFLESETGKETLAKMGAIAFSTNSSKDLKRLNTAINKAGLPWELANKITLQAIPALLDEKTMRELLDHANSNHMRITLLGYKTSGRGGEYEESLEKRDPNWWIDMWKKEFPRLALSIDTTLATQCETRLGKEGVAGWQYHTKEGSWSMYIDGVEQTAAASSYAGDGTPLTLDSPLSQQIEAAFETYAGEDPKKAPARKTRPARKKTTTAAKAP